VRPTPASFAAPPSWRPSGPASGTVGVLDEEHAKNRAIENANDDRNPTKATARFDRREVSGDMARRSSLAPSGSSGGVSLHPNASKIKA
jgi:hypothetical protein